MQNDAAMFELTVMNAESSEYGFEDFYVWGVKHGIPAEILTRLKGLWEFTQKVANEVISFGKIIVNTIWEFLKKNPKLTVGLAIGAAVALLVASVPLLGPVLQPISSYLLPLYGAGVGSALEIGERPIDSKDPFVAAVSLANKFFELFIEICNAVAEYWGK